MSTPLSRRDFVAGAAAGFGNFTFLSSLPAVAADQARLANTKVELSRDMEPLVGLIEETPRDKILEAIVGKIRAGVGYESLLAAVFLAGVRGIQPRPVGFKFHAVLVINSAHLASQAMPDRDRWLPLLWAIDNYKASQARNKAEGNWSMSRIEEGKLPSGQQARFRFLEAMDDWDEQGADRAVASLCRNAGATEVIELFWRYGARDFRDIGHKAIFVANAWRTLQSIGWRHAEPVLRSLAYAILEHEGTNPAKRDGDPDRPGRENLKRLTQIRPDWQRGKLSPDATKDLLSNLRQGSAADGCDQVVKLLNQQIDPASVWDALFLRAAESLMQQPGIVGLHCVTSVNALHYGYLTSGNDETRRLLLLQAAAFLPLFRKAMEGRGKLQTDRTIDGLKAIELAGSGPAGVQEVFAEVSKDRVNAAGKTLALLERSGSDPLPLMTAARRLVFDKGSDSHDYKYSSAALEDYFHVTPAFRNRFLASSMFYLKGTGDKDNELIKRTKAALA